MAFGLKNADAIYQRMMQACMKKEIGRNAQIYVDVVVITTKKGASIDDLRKTFDSLSHYSMKQNPKKCAFGVPHSYILGYFFFEDDAWIFHISKRNCSKLRENTSNTDHGKIDERQRGAANRKTCHDTKLDTCEWTTKAQLAFDDLKRILSASPVPYPREAEPMLLYNTATNQVVSTVLLVKREEEGKVHGFQRLV
jgi:hypothetical protein